MLRLQTLLLFLCCSWCSAADSCRLALPELHDSGAHAAHLDETIESVEAEWRMLLDGTVYGPQYPSGHDKLTRKELRLIDVNESSEEKDRKGQVKVCKASMYGEMNSLRLFESTIFGFEEGDVYIDLGSGTGKPVLGAVLFFNVSKAIGVEFSKKRFDMSCDAIGRTRNSLHGIKCGPHCRERVRRSGRAEFVHANMLEYDISEATKISVFAACLPKTVQKLLQRKLLAELKLDTLIYAPGLKVWDDRTVLDGRMLEHEKDSGNLGAIFKVVDVTTVVYKPWFSSSGEL